MHWPQSASTWFCYRSWIPALQLFKGGPNQREIIEIPYRSNAIPSEQIIEGQYVEYRQEHELIPNKPWIVLRCTRCGGRRSLSYHSRHMKDPYLHPALGICSRRRTQCAVAQRNTRSICRIRTLHEMPVDSDQKKR
jgi:hypothetical protein